MKIKKKVYKIASFRAKNKKENKKTKIITFAKIKDHEYLPLEKSETPGSDKNIVIFDKNEIIKIWNFNKKKYIVFFFGLKNQFFRNIFFCDISIK